MSFASLMNSRRLELSEIDSEDDIDLNLAAAAVMFAVIAADDEVEKIEIAYLVDLLRTRYGLESDDLIDIVTSARRAADNELEITNFVNLLRENLSENERSQLLDDLWELACSDKKIRNRERLAIDRFADALDLDLEVVAKARDMAEKKIELNLS